MMAVGTLAACGGDGDGYAQDAEDLGAEAQPVSCSPPVKVYPVRGKHNHGYDSQAGNSSLWACDATRSNSDFVGGSHIGNDIWAPAGTPVAAAVDGTLTLTGWSDYSGNKVTVRDACGWHHFNAHLQSIAPGMVNGRVVKAGDIIGYVGKTGTASNGVVHLHYSIYPAGNYDAGIDPWPALRAVESNTCGPAQSDPKADGALLREPNGSMAVIAGGAKFDFNSVAELNASGYGGKPYISVADGYLATLPTVARDGALLRDPGNGSIFVIAGAAGIGFASWAELVGAGYEPGPFINVAPRHLAALPSVPRDGTLLRDSANGSILAIAGGAGYAFSSWAELVAAGYETTPFVNVPPRVIQGLASVPANRTLLRHAGTGTIKVIAGGAGLAFSSWPELVAAGYETAKFVNLPGRFVDALSAIPADGTLLRTAGSPTVWRVVGGVRSAFTPPAGASIVEVGATALAAIPQA